MQYLYRRGSGAMRRVMHLCGYNPATGQPTMRPLCGVDQVGMNTTCNLPLGQPTCKRCRVKAAELQPSR